MQAIAFRTTVVPLRKSDQLIMNRPVETHDTLPVIRNEATSDKVIMNRLIETYQPLAPTIVILSIAKDPLLFFVPNATTASWPSAAIVRPILAARPKTTTRSVQIRLPYHANGPAALTLLIGRLSMLLRRQHALTTKKGQP